MGHDPDPKTKELQKQNLEAFYAWIKAHGNMIMPIPGKAVIYAGFPPGDLAKIRGMANSNDAQQPLRRMWQLIEAHDKTARETTGQVTYDKLNDVLKRLKGPLPKLVATDGADIGHPKKFSDMLSCAERMTDKNWSLVDKGRFNDIWDALSEQYVKNSKGEVDIWEGRKLDFARVNIGTTLIRKELNALLARKDLPEATRRAAEKLMVGYAKHHEAQQFFSEKMVKAATESLRAGRKH